VENRKIIHLDMDAFFASVEQRDKPEYRGKPVIVGGLPDKRGVVAACSYEARQFGIHSAMPSSRAYRLCPKAIFLQPRFDAYRKVSTEIQSIFKRYTNLVEPLSLDEAYLDVRDCKQYQGSATLIARSIKETIKKETELTASAGVSYNKFLAKIASDMDKPDGLYLITPEQGEKFVEQLAVRKIHGIGKATEAKMKILKITTGADLKQWAENALINQFGKAGLYYYQIARGIDHRPVRNNRIRKSIGSEITFQEDLSDVEVMLTKLNALSEKVFLTLIKKKLSAKTVTLKVKYNDFELISRSVTKENSIKNVDDISQLLKELLKKTQVGTRKVRLLGVSVSKLESFNELITEQGTGDDQLILI
jgi:DNA polymerase-4